MPGPAAESRRRSGEAGSAAKDSGKTADSRAGLFVARGKVAKQADRSADKLQNLHRSLDGLRGHDETDPAKDNLAEVPLSADDLELLRATVAGAMALTQVPKFPERVTAALRQLYEILEEFKKLIDKLADNFGALKGLAGQVAMAALAVKELIDILAPMFS